MAFQVSPGVNTSEIDLTNVVVGAGTSTGGFAGRFHWGPIEEVTLITDEDNLVEQFRKPDDNNFEHFFTASSFLAYTSALNLVRAANTTSSNAAAPLNAAANTSAYVNVQITTSEDYYLNYDSEQGGAEGGGISGYTADGWAIAKWAGALGNSLKVSICPADRPSATLTGNVDWAASTGALTADAADTLFDAELRVGDAIKIADETGYHIITAITSNVAATAFSTSSTDSADVNSKVATLQKRSAFGDGVTTYMKGTVTVTLDSATVTGTGTLFTTQFIVGDTIVIGAHSRRVKTLTSNTVMVTDTKWEAAAATQAYKREWEYKNAQGFGGAPGTSDHVEDKLMTLDEVHIAVVD